MVADADARNAVRELIKRFDMINEQRLSLAYVLARRDLKAYARLLESAERATALVIRPLKEVDNEDKEIYAALDDPNGDRPKAILAMLDSQPIVLTGDAAVARMELLKELDDRFDAEDEKGSRGDQ